jgi:hypothetical protein
MPIKANSRTLLQERTVEIFNYLRFLKLAVEKDACICNPHSAKPTPFKKALTHTLKANTYLLLYNVVEAAMAQAINDIHDAIKESSLSVDVLNPSLFKEALRQFTKKEKAASFDQHAPCGELIFRFWLDNYKKQIEDNRNPLFSGNLDSKKIIEIGENYGFLTDGNRSKVSHESLKLAKDKRNQLAHGKLSFKDCGRDLSVEELTQNAIALLRCLRRLIYLVELYMTERRYQLVSCA